MTLFRLWMIGFFILMKHLATADLPKPFQDSLRLSHEDMILPEKGIDFIFGRFYNGSSKYDGPFGPGWGFTFGASLIFDQEKMTIILKDYDGLISIFEKLDENLYRSTSNPQDAIKILSDGSFERKIGTEGIQFFRPDGNLEKISDAHAQTFLLLYRDGKLNSILTPSGRQIGIESNPEGKITQISEPDGRVVTYQYDEKGRLSRVKDIFKRETQYFYDDANNIQKVIYPDETRLEVQYLPGTGKISELKTPGEPSTHFEYLRDHEWRVSFGSDYQVTYSDDPAKSERIVSDDEGIVNIFKYDLEGKLIESQDALKRITKFSYDDSGHMTVMVDPSGQRVEYVYDDSTGRMMIEKSNDRVVKEYEYNPSGDVTGIKNEYGVWTRYTYDEKGLPLDMTDEKGRTTFYTYDAFGNLSQGINAEGKRSYFSYDGYGRKLEESDDVGNKVTYTYDPQGNLTQMQSSNGLWTKYEYDPSGRLIKEIRPGDTFQEFKYDAHGSLTERKNWEGSVFSYKFNENHQLLEEAKPNGAKLAYTYNIRGQLIKKEGTSGNITSFEYDKAGNLIKKTFPNGASIQYFYDLSDRLIKKTRRGKTIEWKYDSEGNLEGIQGPGGWINLYDAQGRLLSTEFKDSGSKIDYEYDAKGNLSSIGVDGFKTMYMYDDLNRTSSITDDENNKVSYEYSKEKYDYKEILSNGITTAYSFDAFGHLMDVLASLKGRPLFGYSLLRNADGKVIEKKSLSGVLQKFEYDVMGRLKYFYQDDSNWEKYTYDATHNIISIERPKGKQPFSYNRSDELLSDGTSKYHYDLNGHLIKKEWQDIATSYSYDDEGQLLKVESSTGNYSEFDYDSLGRRIFVESPQDTRYYIYSFEDLLLEQDHQGYVRRIYSNGLGIDHPLFFKENGKVYFYHRDHLGSIIAITDEKGEIANHYLYGAFGKIIEKKESIPNQFLYTAREQDEIFGIYYCRARFYDPSMYRFISEDLLKNDNLYAYVENDPVNRTDPFGLASTYVPPQARLNTIADGMGFNRPQYTPQIRTPGGGLAYGVHETTALGNNPAIRVSRLALNTGTDQVRSTLFHENVHELQRMRNPYGFATTGATDAGSAALEREAHMRTYEYTVRNGLSREVQQHSLDMARQYGGTQAEIEGYMARVGTKIPTQPSLLGRTAGALGRAAGTAAAAYGAFEAGYAVGTVIEDRYHVGENMGIRDWREEQLVRNMGIEEQEQLNAAQLEEWTRYNVNQGNLHLRPGVDPNTIGQTITDNLNNNRPAITGMLERPEDKEAREQREREEAYQRYEVEQARLAIERRQREEEFEGKKSQIEGLISLGQAAELRGLSIPSKVQAALQSAKASEGAVNAIVESVKGMPNKVTQVNGLIQAAKALASAIQAYQISGTDIVNAYSRAKDAKDGACDIANNMDSVSDPMASAELARQRASLAQGEASAVNGAGAKALSTSSSAESALGQIQAFQQQADAIIAEIGSAKGQLAQLQSLMEGAVSAMNGVANAGSEIDTAIAEVTSYKNGAIGFLAPYLSLETAKPLYVQASSLGTKLMGVKVDALLNDGTATVQRITTKIAEVAALAETAVPDFNVALGPLQEKVQDLRATADTIDVFESKIVSEAANASSCASQAASMARPRNQNPQGQGPSQGPVQPPPGWSPTGDSVAGPSVPGQDAQNTSFGGATTQIEDNNQQPPMPPDSTSQEPGQEPPATQRPPGGQEHPGSNYGGGNASDMM